MKPPFTLPPRQTWIDHTSDLPADLDTVYALLSDIDRWPQWTPGLRSIRRPGRGLAQPGSFFLMTLEAPIVRRLVLPNVVYRNDRQCIEWGGGLLGSVIRHSLTLTPLNEHTTRVRHLEYATGLLCLAAWPAAGFAHMHDLRWSRAIEAHFAAAAAAPGRPARRA
ncbi:MAG: Polyketide cyclase / dehydrase and lipid transport [Pseudomonadota bacterium]|jgi:hypothetical protein